MTTLTFPEDCGNSPKSLFAIDFYTALLKGDKSTATKMVTEDLEYIIYGDNTYSGISGLEKLIDEFMESAVNELTFENVISHGKFIACKGHGSLEDDTPFTFAEFLQFENFSKSAKIQKIESWTIMLDQQ